MSLLRNQVVKAECPGCHKSLKIPANWISEPMKCKHCGLVFQAKSPPAAAPKTPLPAKPFAPPPGIPVGLPAPANVPVAQPAFRPAVAGGAVPTAAPVAIPVGSAISASVPTATPIPVGLTGNVPPPRRLSQSRGRMQKLVFLVVFLLGLGSIGLVMVNMVPGLNGDSTEVASVGTNKSATSTLTEPTRPTGPAQITRPILNTRPIISLPPPSKTGRKPPRRETRITRRKPRTEPLITRRPPEPERMTQPEQPPKPVDTVSVPKGSFPRRLLAISVNNYPYANPVSYGSSERSLANILRQFAELMKIPDDQVMLLSDRGRLPLTTPEVPPVKQVIEQAITEFLGQSRPQDRIILMFVGHCVEIDDTPYLVPLEGEKENKETLIPMGWLYARLAACPAQQRVLMLDVCRFDPGRGAERGEVAPLGEKTDAMLAKPPKGVQVLTACVAGQRSLELTNRLTREGVVDGGILLNQIPLLRATKWWGIMATGQRPSDPFPLEELRIKVASYTAAMADKMLHQKQTPRLSGEEIGKKIAFDPKASLPSRITPKLPAIFKSGIAERGDVQQILTLALKIPPVKEADKGKPFHFSSLPPYPRAVVKVYADDGGDVGLRAAIQDGIDALIKSDQSKEVQIRETFDKPPTQQQLDQIKKQFELIQKEKVGEELFELGKMIEELEARKEAADKASKETQANYTYVLARLYQRQAYILEYTAMLGKIRRDDLPQLDPQVNKGWRLAAKKDMSDKDGKDLADKSRKLLEKLAKDHKGTPWELIAKREAMTALGLEWQPN